MLLKKNKKTFCTKGNDDSTGFKKASEGSTLQLCPNRLRSDTSVSLSESAIIPLDQSKNYKIDRMTGFFYRSAGIYAKIIIAIPSKLCLAIQSVPSRRVIILFFWVSTTVQCKNIALNCCAGCNPAPRNGYFSAGCAGSGSVQSDDCEKNGKSSFYFAMTI